MRNIKIEKQFVGHEYWPNVAFVDVKGIPEAEEFPRDVSEEEEEKVIQGWKNIAVLKVTPDVPFKFGYTVGEAFHYLKETIESEEGMFGVRVGNGDVRFFVLPVALDQDLSLELVEITSEDDLKYSDLSLY